MTFLTRLNALNRNGTAAAVPSVCTAHPDALAASLLLAQELDRPVLIEATSNQVNQYGGYTGMQPSEFIGFVKEIAAGHRIDRSLIHFGGDHLGPQAWRDEPAASAMEKAEELVRAYVRVGFTKIHLDCSEGCLGEPAQVNDETAAARAARLAAVCEKAADDPAKLHYVIGTEVPPPGGGRATDDHPDIQPTSPERAAASLAAHRSAFDQAGIAGAWERIAALVVQPGLEFSSLHLHRFDMDSPDILSDVLREERHICFEAHSTDYQSGPVFRELASRHFSVLKVGPALTFAYRRALYALDSIRDLMANRTGQSRLQSSMEALMRSEPKHWIHHYHGNEDEVRIQRHHAYSDRIRYYWPHPRARAAVADLFAALDTSRPADPLLLQYFPADEIAAAKTLEGSVGWARSLAFATIQRALRPYFLH